MRIIDRIARNTLFTYAATILNGIIFVVFVAYAARILGPIEFGIYALIETVIFFVSFFIKRGIYPAAVRELAKTEVNKETVFNHVFSLYISLTLMLYLSLFVLVNILGYEHRIRILIYMMGACFILDAIFQCFTILPIAIERMGTPLLAGIFLSLSASVSGVIVLHLGYGLEGLLVINLIVKFIGVMLYGSWTKRRFFEYKFSFSLKAWVDLLKQALPFSLLAFLNQVQNRISIIMLSKMPGPIPSELAIGYFSPAEKTARSLNYFPMSLGMASFPALSRNIKNKEIIEATLDKMIHFIFIFISTPLFIAALFIPDIILVIFGAKYASSIAAFRFLGISYAFIAINLTVSSALFSTRLVYKLFPSLAIVTIITITTGFILIPKYSFMGIAFAVLIDKIIRTALYGIFLKRLFGINVLSLIRYRQLIKLFSSIFIGSYLLSLINWGPIGRLILVTLLYSTLLCILAKKEVKALFTLLKKIIAQSNAFVNEVAQEQ